MHTLQIQTNCDILPAVLNGDLPDGVRVIAPPIYRTRAFDVQITSDIHFEIVIDVAKIAPTLLAAWLLRHVRRFKRPPTINLNGKALPPNDADAVKMITDAVDNEESKKPDGK